MLFDLDPFGDPADRLPDDLRAVVNASTDELARARLLGALQARLVGGADVVKGTRALGSPWTEAQHHALSAALAEITRLSSLLARRRVDADSLAPPKG